MALHNQTQPKLPVITFDKETLSPSSWLSTSHQVREALENYGCLVVSTDKIPLNLRDTVFNLSRDLFQLPMETKVKNTCDLPSFGYGNYKSLPLCEFFGIEDGATLQGTQTFTDQLFPSGNESFCENIFEYTRLLSDIDHCVMRMVFDSYGVEVKHCDRLIESSLYLGRFLKYRAPNEEEGQMALPAHTDKSFLAVLDDNHVQGLEIEMRNGDWIQHNHSPSTFLVIAGEPFMAWSNGRIHAPVHQVAMRTLEKEVIRYTIGIFSFMQDIIEVPEELIDESENSLRFKPFNHLDFLKYYVIGEGKTSKCAIKSYCGVTITTDT